MSIYKRGKVYWYKFTFKGEPIRESTRQGNDKVARQMEAAHKTSLARGEVGLRDKKPVPTVAEFAQARFEPWVKSTTVFKTWRGFYAVGLRAINEHKPLANAKLNEVTSERAAEFAAHRRSRGLKVSTVNASLRVLRRVLKIAAEWGVIDNVPKVRLLPGEAHRERVITRDEESRYLSTAAPLLSDIATVLFDTGLRPEECYRLVWESIGWANGRNGTLMVTHGKTKAARRVLPLTPRVRHVLETRWNAKGRPAEGFVWPAPTQSGHVEPSSLKKQHAKALRIARVRPFVLYSARHTFLTRLGESGCDAWTLARIAGHSSIAMSARYVHPSEDAVLTAMARLGGHKSGHNPKLRDGSADDDLPVPA